MRKLEPKSRRVFPKGRTTFGRATAAAHADDLIRRDDMRLRKHVEVIITALLAAPVFDETMVGLLVHRHHFPDACSVLTALIKWPGTLVTPAAILWAADNDLVCGHRLAFGFGMFTTTKSGATRRDRQWLRGAGSEDSRTVLAMLGECDWPPASSRERAGYLLHHVVGARLRA